MHKGISLTDLAVELDRQKNAKKDYVAPTSMIKAHVEPESAIELELEGHGNFPVLSTARTQLKNFVDIPSKYFERCASQAPHLLELQLNHWLHRNENGARMVRTLDHKARALLSPSYRPLDNYDLASVALPVIADLGLDVLSCNVSENYLHIEVRSTRIQGEVKRGDVVQAGFVVSNSEVGLGRLTVEELQYRLLCLNGMIGAKVLGKTHVGRQHDSFAEVQEFLRDDTRALNDAAFFETVKDSLQHLISRERFERTLSKLQEAAGVEISAPPQKAIAVVAERVGLLQSEQESVLQHLIKGGDLSKWGYANALTAVAHSCEDYDRNIELQRAGSTVIELNPRDWEKAAERVKLAA